MHDPRRFKQSECLFRIVSTKEPNFFERIKLRFENATDIINMGICFSPIDGTKHYGKPFVIGTKT